MDECAQVAIAAPAAVSMVCAAGLAASGQAARGPRRTRQQHPRAVAI